MTKEQALHAFYSSFGWPAYQEDALPTGQNAPQFPFITYEIAVDSFGNEIPLSVSLWDRSPSWTPVNAKAREIANAVTRGGRMLPCDGGGFWLKPGSPFIRSMGDEADDMIKRKIFNFEIEYITEV